MMRTALLALVLIAASAVPAQAGGVIAALQVAFAAGSVGGIGAAVAAGFGALGAFTKFAIGIGISLAGQLFAKKPKGINDAGIQTEQTTTGDVTPLKFPVGFYGLEGHAVAPAYSRAKNNAILTYILEVSNIPGVQLTGRVAIDGQWADILEREPLGAAGADGAKALDGFLAKGIADRAWLWFEDGTQTEAHPHLVEHYADHPDRPWTTDHVLRGTAYAILEFQRDPEFFSGLPSVLFEVEGIPLYDPRKDSSAGGLGPHRHGDPATWEPSRNPQVISYNVLRGIALPNGDVYGGEIPAEDLPLDTWFAAMNECDVLIGDRPQYQAGFEINTNEMEPAEVIEEMNRASFAQISEFGGVFRVRVGAPAAPVMALTDEDFMIHEGAVDDLFPTQDQTFNAGSGNYNDPEAVWQARALETVLDSDLEAEDGGRRLPQNIALPAVFDISQGQHLLESYVKDSRRFRVHTMTLPPSFALLEPLDTVSFTSTRNGYTEKLFEVVDVEDRPGTLQQRVSVREREPGDVAWTALQDLPQPPAYNGLTQPLIVIPLITLAPFTVVDSNDVARRSALRLSWVGELPSDAASVQWELRLAPGGAVVASGVAETERGEVEIHDVLPDTTYEARARYVIDAPREWSAWTPATTGDIRMTAQDFADAFNDQVNTAFDRHDAALGADGVPQSVADLLAHVRLGLGGPALPLLPDQSGAPDLVAPLGFQSVTQMIERERRRIDFEVPRSFDRDAALDEISEAVISGLLETSRTRSLIADAGVYVGPESGRVRIQADGLTGEAQIVVDALQAEIISRVTFSDLDQAIVNANFDPSQIAELDEVFFRLSTAETVLDAQDGAITSLTETLTVDGGVITMTEVTNRLSSVEGEIVDFITVTQFEDLEQSVTTVEQTLSGFDGARFETVLTDISTLTEEADIDAATTLAGLLDNHRDRKAVREAAALARQDIWARADATDVAVAGLRVDLGVTFEDARALIQQEAVVRASSDQAFAETVEIIEGRVGTAEGALQQINTVDITSESALVQSHVILTGRVGDVEGVAADIINLDLDPNSALLSQTRLLQASIGSSNLAVNGDLRTGDFTGWQAVSALMSVVPRGASGIGVIDNAPAPFMLRIDAGAFASARLSDDIPMRPDEQIELSFAAALLTGGSADVNLRIEWLDGGGAVLGVNIQTLTVAGNFWRRSEFGPVTPLPETEMMRIFIRRSPTTDVVVVADINVTRISADQVETKAQVSDIAAIKVDASGAVAAVEQRISAQYGDLAAMASATGFAEATADGISAGYVWRLNDQNVLEAVSVQDGVDDGPTSTFRIAADFVQITGIAQIDTAVLAELAAENAFIKNLTVTNANLSGPIKSDNFVDGETGWRITRSGGAQFNGPVISRNIVAAEGDFAPGILGQIASDGPNVLAEFNLIPTGIFLPVNQVWMPSNAAYLAYAAFSGGATSPSFTDKDDVFWGVTAELQPFARWNGPQQLYLKATVWARNRVTLHAQGDPASSGRIFWTVYKVT